MFVCLVDEQDAKPTELFKGTFEPTWIMYPVALITPPNTQHTVIRTDFSLRLKRHPTLQRGADRPALRLFTRCQCQNTLLKPNLKWPHTHVWLPALEMIESDNPRTGEIRRVISAWTVSKEKPTSPAPMGSVLVVVQGFRHCSDGRNVLLWVIVGCRRESPP